MPELLTPPSEAFAGFTWRGSAIIFTIEPRLRLLRCWLSGTQSAVLGRVYKGTGKIDVEIHPKKRMPSAQVTDFQMNFSRSVHRGERAAGAFLGVVFSAASGSRKSSEHPADLSVFRQKHRGCMSTLACKIERFCLVPLKQLYCAY